ncbi:MAG: hypothetical protein P8J37_21855 [Fuerstiella sp.]|nr:hypothetical protein [Fuerstiella sp.]
MRKTNGVIISDGGYNDWNFDNLRHMGNSQDTPTIGDGNNLPATRDSRDFGITHRQRRFGVHIDSAAATIRRSDDNLRPT